MDTIQNIDSNVEISEIVAYKQRVAKFNVIALDSETVNVSVDILFSPPLSSQKNFFESSTVNLVNEYTEKELYRPLKRTFTVPDIDNAGTVNLSSYSISSPIKDTYDSPYIDFWAIKSVYNYLFYTKILDFGLVRLAPKTLSWELVNTTLNNLTVTSINIPEHFGVVLSGASVGDVVQSGEQLAFTLTALPEANYAYFVDDDIVIVLNNYIILTIRVKIVREYNLYILPTPDKDSYKEELYFKTLIFESASGAEKRKALLLNPKYKCSFTITKTVQTSSNFAGGGINDLVLAKNYLFAATRNIIYMPLYSHSVPVLADVNNSSTVFCDVEALGVVEGDSVVFYSHNIKFIEGVICVAENSETVIYKVLEVNKDFGYIVIDTKIYYETDYNEVMYLAPLKKMKHVGDIKTEHAAGNTVIKYNISLEEI